MSWWRGQRETRTLQRQCRSWFVTTQIYASRHVPCLIIAALETISVWVGCHCDGAASCVPPCVVSRPWVTLLVSSSSLPCQALVSLGRIEAFLGKDDVEGQMTHEDMNADGSSNVEIVGGLIVKGGTFSWPTSVSTSGRSPRGFLCWWACHWTRMQRRMGACRMRSRVEGVESSRV